MKKLFFILFMLIYTSSVQALSWAYSFVVWNGNVYEVTKEKVLEKEIGESIGEVKTTPNDMTGNYYGDASNVFPKGTKYYEINNVSTDLAIAVEVEENMYQKVTFIREAPFHWMDTLPFIVLLVLTIIIVIDLRRLKK